MKKLLESLKISQKNTQQSPELKEEVKVEIFLFLTFGHKNDFVFVFLRVTTFAMKIHHFLNL